MKQSIAKNYVFNVLYQLLNLITPLITTPYIARVLNADGIGIYNYITSIASNFVLVAGLGTSTYGQREISYHRKNVNEKSNIFWEVEILSLSSVAITLICYLLFSLFQPDNKLLYFLCGLQIITVALDVSWLFSGIEEFKKICVRNMIFKVLTVLAILFFVKDKSDLAIYTMLVVVIPLIKAAALWFYLPSYVEKIRISNLHPFRHFKGTIELFVPSIAIQIYCSVDKVMLGFITGNDFEVGYYSEAYKLVRIILTVITALGTVMIPRIGFYYKEKRKREMQEMIYKGFSFAWMMALPACLGLIAIADNFVPWFLGDGYDKVIPLIKILSLTVIAVGLNNVTGLQYLVPTGKQNVFTLTVVLGSIVNIILNGLSVPIYLSLGAAAASVVAEFVVFASELVSMRKDFSIKHIFVLSKNYICGCAIMMIILEIEKAFFVPSIINTVIMIATGALTYGITLLLLRDEFLYKNIIAKVYSWISAKQ